MMKAKLCSDQIKKIEVNCIRLFNTNVHSEQQLCVYSHIL